MRTQKGVLPVKRAGCHGRLARGGWGEAPGAKRAGPTPGPGSGVLWVWVAGGKVERCAGAEQGSPADTPVNLDSPRRQEAFVEGFQGTERQTGHAFKKDYLEDIVSFSSPLF